MISQNIFIAKVFGICLVRSKCQMPTASRYQRWCLLCDTDTNRWSDKSLFSFANVCEHCRWLEWKIDLKYSLANIPCIRIPFFRIETKITKANVIVDTSSSSNTSSIDRNWIGIFVLVHRVMHRSEWKLCGCVWLQPDFWATQSFPDRPLCLPKTQNNIYGVNFVMSFMVFG